MIENEDEFKLLLYSQALSPAFGGTIAFVKETEPLLERGQGCSVFAPLIYTLFYVLISISCTVKAENLLALMMTFVVVVKTSASFDTDNCFQATLVPRDTPHNELYVFGLSLISCFHLERIQQLVRGFASDWKRSIENINQEIMRSFFNFKNGTTILRVSRSKRVATCKVNLVFGI